MDGRCGSVRARKGGVPDLFPTGDAVVRRPRRTPHTGCAAVSRNQVAFEVIGNDVTITMAAEAGRLHLNAFERSSRTPCRSPSPTCARPAWLSPSAASGASPPTSGRCARAWRTPSAWSPPSTRTSGRRPPPRSPRRPSPVAAKSPNSSWNEVARRDARRPAAARGRGRKEPGTGPTGLRHREWPGISRPVRCPSVSPGA
jgi:hypothetical protein